MFTVMKTREVFSKARAWQLMAVAILSLGIAGCSTSKHDAAHESHPAHARLELNNGKKWVVDKPMMAHIRKIEEAVAESADKPTLSHPALATNIQENLGGLVTSCTMEGKAHDELHKWLMPLLGLSAEYTKATDPAVQDETLREIRQSLVVFHEYFE